MSLSIESYNITPSIPYNCNNISDFGIFANRGIMDVYNEMRFLTLESQINIFNEFVTEKVITESIKEKAKEIGKKVKEGLKKIWAKIQEFFARVGKVIKDLFAKTKKEVFSKATKAEFEKSVEFFKTYNGEVVEFCTDKKANESDKDNIFFGTEEFIKSVDNYNNTILNRSRVVFDTISGLFNKSNTSTTKINSLGTTLQYQTFFKFDSIEQLKSATSASIFGYILYDKEFNSGIDDSFGKKEIEAAIYSELSRSSFLRTPITSSNLSNFSNQISKAVYSDAAGKWMGITKNSYSELKKMIDVAIKNTDIFTNYSNEDFYTNGSIEEMPDRSTGPEYVLLYVNGCKDVATVLVSIHSVMNNMIYDMYKKNIQLVARILNSYWKLNKEKRSIDMDSTTLPGYNSVEGLSL